MEQKNDKGYFVVDMGIYPRKMYIVKGRNSGKVITDNFKGRNDLEINTADCSQDKCDVWDVVEKESLDKGFLIWLRLPPTIEDYAHEAVHVAFGTFTDISAEVDADNQEPFAYLVGWIAKQIKNALNYKKLKNK